MSSEQNKSHTKSSSAPEQTASDKATSTGGSCPKESSQASIVSSFPGGSLARGIYSYTLGRTKTCESDDTTDAPAHGKCDYEPVVEEGPTEKALDKEEHTEPEATDLGAGSCCMRPDSKKN